MKRTLLITTLIAVFLINSVIAENIATQTVTVTILPGEFYVYSPVQNAVYNTRTILMNLSMSSKVSFFKYMRNGDSPRTLCRNCSSYSKKKPFDDGLNELIVMAIFNEGVVQKYINFTVDSKVPIIKKTSPKTGFANGTFTIEFQEENPKIVLLTYGNNLTGYKEKELNPGTDCYVEKKNYYCSIDVDLSEYDLQEIRYWFIVRDIADNMDESNLRKLDVDVSKPVINSFNYTIKKKTVTFVFNVTEPNFDRITYIDNATASTEKTLCSTLKKGICEKKKTFKKGTHALNFTISDEAGNVAYQSVEFGIA
ncbi:MAG: hypothetical protein AABX30_02560 [Nanoarchaeota archaeon]